MSINKRIDIIEEREHAAIIFKELDNLLVKAGEVLIMLVFTGVINSTTIEYISTSIACNIVRNTFFICETIDAHFEFALRIKFRKLPHLGQFGEQTREVRIFGKRLSKQTAEIIDSIRDRL